MQYPGLALPTSIYYYIIILLLLLLSLLYKSQ